MVRVRGLGFINMTGAVDSVLWPYVPFVSSYRSYEADISRISHVNLADISRTPLKHLDGWQRKMMTWISACHTDNVHSCTPSQLHTFSTSWVHRLAYIHCPATISNASYALVTIAPTATISTAIISASSITLAAIADNSWRCHISASSRGHGRRSRSALLVRSRSRPCNCDLSPPSALYQYAIQ